jgi:RHS repeat-associated protein
LSWRQTYTFDRYGNRNFDEATTTTLPKNCGTPQNPTVCPEDVARLNPEINPANNRLSSPGWQYDVAGNTIRDAENRRFAYDGENKQVKVETVDAHGNPIATIGQYFYDGDGRRVKKIVPSTGETTVFVYDASNKLVAEYSTIVEPQSTAKVSYLTTDHLGSPRITTDQNGAVISRRDFAPYGEELGVDIPLPVGANGQPVRTTAQGYVGADSIRQKFTSYDRDNETGLDFAQARMYNFRHGRFTTVDDFTKDSNLKDPESWNKYIYVRNKPLNLIDPTGEKAEIDVQVDRKTKVVTVTVTASIGLWSKPGTKFKPDLAKVKKNVEAQINKWGGSIKIAGGYTLNVQVNVTVKTFDSARSSDDVLKADNTIMNVIQLVDRPATKECGGGNSCIGGGDPATIKNPDGTLPDIGTWRYTTARDTNEPAHEFFHILGKSHNAQEQYGTGWTGNPFAEQGTTNITGATLYDYTRAFGDDVTKAISEAKKEDNKWRWQTKRDVIVRPRRIVRCCTP